MNRHKYLNKEEVKAILGVAKQKGGVAWLLVDTALQTGLRVSELQRIQIQDVDLRRYLIRITRSKKLKPKVESLPISNELNRHLANYIRSSKRTEGPLFVGLQGPLTTRGLQQIWDAARKAAGLPNGLSIHCARHTMATHMITRTGNLKLVQQQLGHASPVTTANMYAAIPFPERQKQLNGLYK